MCGRQDEGKRNACLLNLVVPIRDLGYNSYNLKFLSFWNRHYTPALALSLLAPKLAWSEAETAAGVREGAVVHRADGQPLSPHDLKRLQVPANAFTCT